MIARHLLPGLLLAGLGVSAFAQEPVKLFVKEVPLTVLGREVKVMAIEQEDGTPGYSPAKAGGFHAEVVNQLDAPTCIHWHGLILPNLMDGVPFVTQDPIPPGGSFLYDFPLVQSGTYWMHSHYGLQEQWLNAAPMILWTPEERAQADKQVVVMLADFSFMPPDRILAGLRNASPKPMKGKMDMPEGMMKTGTPVEMAAQAWDEKEQRLVRTTRKSPPVDIDVKYDALLANRRTMDDPEVVTVTPGETVMMRLIGASSATNFYIDTGALEAELLAVDGKPVEPVKGTFFQLGIAQRIDLRVTIPKDGGAFPILAQGEGTKLQAGIILASEGADIPTLAREAGMGVAALDNTQEKVLRAANPLKPRSVDRTLPCALGGDMATYVWTINGAAYPNRDALMVREGERAEIVFTNSTMMAHPMHLHGHDFQIVEIDGELLAGALRDTVVVPPGSTIRAVFDANNPGVWAFHCHLLYHLASGMFTVLLYEGADTRSWQPEKSLTEVAGPTAVED
ncbi:MAG: multicopper oxidase family protein [Chthoniobacterales bacterium]|nr:multicopper oxidase family protein [Chthoniobacterales bacterium]